jgi:hypothetical protein
MGVSINVQQQPRCFPFPAADQRGFCLKRSSNALSLGTLSWALGFLSWHSAEPSHVCHGELKVLRSQECDDALLCGE